VLIIIIIINYVTVNLVSSQC